MKAVILAGGIGVRLRPFTFSIPKPLLPIGEQPILEIIIKRLKKFGFREFILAIGYKSKMVETYFRDGHELGVSISYMVEEKPSGTAGPLAKFIENFNLAKNESIFLMNGDILTKLNFSKMIAYHQKNNFDITVGIKQITEKKSYGFVDVRNCLVRNIVEKPNLTRAVNAGIYIIKSSAIKEIPKNKFFTMPNLINKLIAKKRSVGAYSIKENWIGLEDIQYFEDVYNNKRAWRELKED